MDELDNLVRNALVDEVYYSEQDIDKNFLIFKNTLFDNKSKRYSFQKLSYISFKKIALVSIFSLLCIVTISLCSSNTVRAAALTAIDGIKSIFVVEGTDNDIKIVQKPASEALFIHTEGYQVDITDTELEKLLNYKVIFPETLSGGFEFKNRALLVVLGKAIPYAFIPQISKQMNKAIENQEEFTKLADYSPSRNLVGNYRKGNETISIFTSPVKLDTQSDYSKIEKVKIGDIDALWCTSKFPVYPYKKGESDMSVKPTIEDSYSLNWVNNDIQYSLPLTSHCSLSKEEAIKVATEIQAAQE